MTKICAAVQDLLPLYVDQTTSSETSQFVEEHLAQCTSCSSMLDSLRSPGGPALPEASGGDAPGDEARFLLRLRRNAGTALGLVLVLLALTALGTHRYASRAYSREYARQQAEQRALVEESMAALRTMSPPAPQLLKSYGIAVETTATRERNGLQFGYSVAWPTAGPVDYLITVQPTTQFALTAAGPDGREQRLTAGGGSSSWTRYGASGAYAVPRVPDGPFTLTAQYPVFAVHLQADQAHRWEFRRPADGGEARIGERVSVHGVEFEIDRVLFDGDRVRILYRQLTDPQRVGVHFLTFRLSDRLGGAWSQTPLQVLPDPRLPQQEFRPVNSPSQQWSLSIDHAVLAIPGVTAIQEVK